MTAIKICMVMLVCLVFIQAGHSQNIEFVGSYEDLTNVFDVYVEWPYAYVCQHVESPSFVILDISDPSEPVLVGQWGELRFCHDMEIRGDYAFIANGMGGFLVVDISDPANPYGVIEIGLGGRGYNLFVEGSLAYLATGYKGLYIIDISDPSNPVEIGQYDTPGSAAGVIVRDEIAYVPDNWDILHTLDVSDPSDPQLMGTVTEEGLARKGVAITENIAYVATWENSVYIIDIEDPQQPYTLGIYETPGHCLDLYINEYLYISDFEAGIQVVDISNPSEPTLVAEYDTPGGARSITVFEDYIFVADTSSLQILSLIVTGVDGSGDELPDHYSILKNYPNPFNSSTVISYEISRPGFVNLSIYNIGGQKVASLVNQNHETGAYSVTWNADGLSSSIYLARLDTGDSSNTIKMHLLK